MVDFATGYHPDPPGLRLNLGRCVTTPGLCRALAHDQDQAMKRLSREVIPRVVRGDWGEVSPEDQQANDRDLAAGLGITAAYNLVGVSGQVVHVLVVYEPDAEDGPRTTLMCSDEY